MEMLLVILLIFLLSGLGFVIYLLTQKQDNSAFGLLKQDLVHMNERLDKAATVFGGLQNELGKMQELGRGLKDIQDVLKSPKLRGNIGEQLMADLIRQQIPKSNFSFQHGFRSGEKVDAVIKTNGGLIPIDSKFPAENYLKYVQATDETEKLRAQKDFVSDVKKHIQAIAKKYILPGEGTVDFALMYVPGESVYYEIITNTDLCDFGAGQRVYLVSPQSFYYFLQSVLLGLEGEMIEQKAKEVMGFLKAIQSDSRRFGDDLSLVGRHLTNAKNAMDMAANNYAKLGSKIESANQLSAGSTQSQESRPQRNIVLPEETKVEV